MQHGHVLQGDLHAHVAPGHHDAVHHTEDLVNVVHALHVLDFGNDVDGVAVILLQNAPDGQDVLGAAGEGGGNVIEAVLNAENDVGPVLFADKGHGKLGARHVDALVVGNLAPVDHRTYDVGIGHFLGPQFHQSVVDEHPGAGFQVFGQVLIGDGNHFFVPFHLPGGEGERVAGPQLDRPVLEGLHPDLRAFGVQDRGDGQAQFFQQAGDSFQLLGGILMGTVGKVETGCIHAPQHQPAQDAFVLGGGAQRADDLGFSQHSIHPFGIWFPGTTPGK